MGFSGRPPFATGAATSALQCPSATHWSWTSGFAWPPSASCARRAARSTTRSARRPSARGLRQRQPRFRQRARRAPRLRGLSRQRQCRRWRLDQHHNSHPQQRQSRRPRPPSAAANPRHLQPWPRPRQRHRRLQWHQCSRTIRPDRIGTSRMPRRAEWAACVEHRF